MIQTTTPCKKAVRLKRNAKMYTGSGKKGVMFPSPFLHSLRRVTEEKDSFFQVQKVQWYAKIKFAPPNLKQRMNFFNLYRERAFTRLDLFCDEGSHLNMTKKRYKERRETKDDKNPFDA
ncbi:hypothetical protein TWF718_008297 [Orbilia javanica]|uniref:Uncharacterized protein n=1 Tax=Orbilia javanica TaxID=47235 RepID=A0AAN8MSF8_9PEZI